MISVVLQGRRPSIVVLGERCMTTSLTNSIPYNHRSKYAFVHHASVAKQRYILNGICFKTKRTNNALPNSISLHQTMMRLSFSSSSYRIVSPRNTHCQYNGDTLQYGDASNCKSHYSYTKNNDRHLSTRSATAFQYSPYPLTVCGLQLSADAFPTSSDNEDDGVSNIDAANQRVYPPSLSDDTSYGNGFGAYQYNYNDMNTGRNSSYDDVDDQLDQQGTKRQQQLIPKTFNPKSANVAKPAVKRSNMYGDRSNAARQSQHRQPDSTSIRPPVKVTIPSLSTDDSIKSQPLIDVDLSSYDNIFDSNNDDESSTTSTLTTTQGNLIVEETPVFSKIAAIKSTRPPVGESLIPTSHFHAGQSLDGLPGYDPAFDQFLTKAAYGVGTTTSIDVLQEELATVEQAVYEQNNNLALNINSSKQVAIALFGTADNYSTNKDVLEGMAGGGNRLAALILQYRAIKLKLAKYTRQEESKSKGTAVRSALTVARPVKEQPDEIVKMNQTSRNVAPGMTAEQQPVVSEMRNVRADPLLLLDASAYIFRAYYSMPPIHRPDGMPTGAVMGFCKMLNSLILHRMLEGEEPRLVLCFDAKGKTFRHDVYDKYKANRPSAPMDLVPQFDLVRQAAKAYGICQIEAYRFEADDVIATLACKAIAEGLDANIMSGDKDLMQLVTDLNATPSIQIIDPMKKERTTYQQVLEKWEVPPNKLGDLLALAGDTADNVPGVRGIGPKTAAKLINDFGSLENLLNNIDSVKQQGVREKLHENKANAQLSRILVELNCTVPMNELIGLPDGVDQKITNLRMEAIDPDRIIEFYDQMGFKELKRSFQNSLKGVKVKRKKSSSYNKRPKATIPTPEDYKDVPF